MPVSPNEVAHKMFNDKLDATAAGTVAVTAFENSHLQAVLKAQGFFLLLILKYNSTLILMGKFMLKTPMWEL